MKTIKSWCQRGNNNNKTARSSESNLCCEDVNSLAQNNTIEVFATTHQPLNVNRNI